VKGIILNLVEEAIVADHGEVTWEALLESAQVDGVYTSLGNYADDDLARLLAGGAETLGVDIGDLSRELGRRALAGLAARYPHYLERHASTRSLLLTLDDVIHAEVRKLYPDSSPPDFWCENRDHPTTLVVHYRSQRRLCALAEGMIHGAAAHYGEQVTITHDTCMLDGADDCTLRVTARAG